MKKTLIALAVLAASGASFAQVTITGNVTMGYRSTTTGGVTGVGGADAAGLGYDTAGLTFVANEDLGGGYKAKAEMNLDVGARSASAGENAILTLTTPAGALVLGTVKAGDYLSGGLAGVGAYNQGWDGKVLSARTSRDTASFVVPVGAFTLSATYQESATLLGLGAGTTGAETTTGQSMTGLSATYASGALSANGTFLQFASNGAAGKTKDQTRLSGNYDLGVAKLGAGVVVTNQNGGAAANPKFTDMLIGAKMPMGAVTFGATFVSRKMDDMASVGGTSGTGTGTSLELGYALSKRTSVIANYGRWTQTSTAAGVLAGQDASSQYNVLLSHSF